MTIRRALLQPLRPRRLRTWAWGLGLLAVLWAPSGVAQTEYTVSGRVVDAYAESPIESASVAVWRVSARAGVEPFVETGAVTGSDGAFRVEGLSRGRYYVVVSFVGYASVMSDTLRLRPESPAVDLGEIRLAADPEALGDVEVTAERDRVEVQVDRTVYTISDDPILSGASTSEALETIPSVEVDVDGNVSLRGNGNVVVLIDGRPAPVGRDFIGVYLQSLPADAVERIEVVPNPSAAFRPDGSAGILNIVLKENTELGLGGALTAGADTQGGYAGTALGTLGRGPLRLALTTSVRQRARDRDGSRFRINRFLGDAATTLDQTSLNGSDRLSGLLSLNADVAVTPQTTLTGTVAGSVDDGVSDEETATRVALGELTLDDALRLGEEDGAGRSGSLRLGIRHDFEGVSEETAETPRRGRGGRGGRGRGGRGGGSRVALGTHGLALDLRVDASTDDDTESIVEQVMEGTRPAIEQRIVQGGDRRSASAQLDYARPIGETRLELGYRGDVETGEQDRSAEVLDPVAGWVPDPGLTNAYRLDEQVHAVYAQVARQLGIVAVQAGLRAETASRSFILGGESFDQSYESLFPSASATVDLGTATVLRAQYSRRIDRPRGRQLNPFPSTDDPLNIRVGNPDLRPEYTNAVEVGVIRQTAWGSVTVSPFLRHTTDVVTRFQSVDGAGVTTSTFRNLDEATSSGVEAIVAVQTGGPVRGFLSLEGFRRTTDGSSVESDLGVDAFGWGGRLNAAWSVGDRLGWGDLDLQATAFYRAPQETEQGQISGRLFMDFGLRQRLLDGRASLAVRARDPFGWAGIDFVQDDAELYQSVTRSFGRQQVGLTFTWTFGQTEERPDRQRLGGGEGGGDEGLDF